MEKIFINEEVNVFLGEEAEFFLSQKNDSKYLKDGSIHVVDKERWNEAQNYEKKTWMELCSNANDDRNIDHFTKFNQYSDLLNHRSRIHKVIELGCGPFTNLRTLHDLLHNLNEVHLVDPLINDYLHHPHCFYKNSNFYGYKTVLHNSPIEELDVEDKFDLVIMNNVLEHCFDITIIFEKLSEMLNEGGLFIFHDTFYKTSEDIIGLVETLYDSGHPIKLSEEYMNNCLSRYKPLFSFESVGTSPKQYSKYFIGMK
jgi:SAM-dependent methyltransferase